MVADIEEAYEYAQAATVEGGKAHEFATLMLETLEMLEPVDDFYEDAPLQLMDETVDSIQMMLTKEYWPMSATIVYYMTSNVSRYATAAPVGEERKVFQLLATRARDLAVELSTGFMQEGSTAYEVDEHGRIRAVDDDDDDEEPPLKNPW
jgi:hypothetical protein